MPNKKRLVRLIVFLSLFQALVLLPDLAKAQDESALAPTKTRKLKLFDTEILVNTYRVVKKRKNPVTLLAIHHNEQTGLNLAKEAVKTRGGLLVELVSTRNNRPQRNLFFTFKNKTLCIDPNRIFSTDGIKADLLKRKRATIEDRECQSLSEDPKNLTVQEEQDLSEITKEIERFSVNFLDTFLPKKRCVRNQRLQRRLCKGEILVAVHNNSAFDVNDPNLSIKTYIIGEEEAGPTESVYLVNNEDLDNFFLVTNKRLFSRLLNLYDDEKQFNISIQKQPPIPDDGSLSIKCGNEKIDYINIEAEHNQGRERQRAMIKVVLDSWMKRR